MKDLKKMVFEHLDAFQALRSYGVVYGLDRVMRCADAAINMALGIELDIRGIAFGGTEEYIESCDYYRNCAALAIERLVKDYGMFNKSLSRFPNPTIVDTIKSLVSIL